ncbi:MAG: alpha/beta hydrolase [Clostridia bacterium]|nr:alpha/beta hydrolase [Clostridia bacterium]
MSCEIKTVNTGKCDIKYFTIGSGKKTFVILPGLSVKSVLLSAEIVASAYDSFAAEYTVYLFDRRENLPERYTVSDMARDTADAMKALGLSDVYLFGASQGGMMALLIAAENPGLVKKLALGSSCVSMGSENFGVIRGWIDLARKKDGRALFLDFGEKLYPREFFEKNENAFAVIGESVTDEEFERFIILAEGTEGFSAESGIPFIKCPVLILNAADDAVLGSRAGEELIAAFKDRPGFSYHVYDGYGHAAFDTAPDYKERLKSFFNA